jgi:hypothetical protein
LGVDFALNTEGYDDAAAGSYTELHRGEDISYVFSATWGEATQAGDWQVGYSYAYVETFAINNSFAQDDWVRWGTAEQIRNSNFKGHGIHGIVALPARFSLAFPDLDPAGGRESTPVRCELLVLNTKAPRVP